MLSNEVKSQQELIKSLQETISLLSLNKDETFIQKRNTTDYDELETYHLSLQNEVNLKRYSKAFIEFQYKNPTTYHVVEHFRNLLIRAGFTQLDEKKNWSTTIKNSIGGDYFTIRNGTSICAFRVGKNWIQSNGVGAINCHIDALTAKLKPASIKDDIEGFQLLGVAPYGGTLNDVWFDRDLGIAGRILVRDPQSNKIISKLINSAPHPIAKIPTLAPHFGQPAVGPFDKEDEAVPVIGFSDCHPKDNEISEDESKCPLVGKHSIHLLRYISKLANVKVSQLVQLDLDLFDVQKGTFGGLKDEFLFAPRLDDRLCSFAAMNALIRRKLKCEENSIPPNTTLGGQGDDHFEIVTLYDNEEVGSLTRQGAKGGLMESVINRVVSAQRNIDIINSFDDSFNECNFNTADIHQLYANSVILSADVNHMLNPNFKNVYMKNHSPKPNVGVTLSLDPNAHMATDVVGVTICEELARINNDKIQYFQIKNNSRSGGTIGPSIASQTGARTIDLGIPQMAMHSIRATTGSLDVGLGVKFFFGFFRNWREVNASFGDL
ncbi:hypothetical protein Kpol_431p10 [Vanderwaltozyma polyspora DSM 70294]|uniref:Aspartyl aminopeptidase n=1 Tax=Vanderwaltozyma polyspora (strain ATCC 22028 / DSM 70294 / BCRC 21397 / CBS 2163 / NBRC 10782 / NRRL Y-8283 / UCD 57-17) TaxID=436907 RepID=A7TRN1_VANPO|nr:uncharacterized protein Kpol_431p10 [Vanderwaltozyma polyspora DSM 70294]EDO15083.1 hypothetical protein Kpol_431p10 [Vanderwaltozyma polyspora DSM 70294]